MTEGRPHGAHVLLESGPGVALQLRDDLHLWGIFGGLVEEGEDPERTALREIGEELSIRLDATRLTFLRTFEGSRYVSHLFRYELGDELRDAVLTEGLRYALVEPGDLDESEVVPWHWTMLRWYWDDRSGSSP